MAVTLLDNLINPQVMGDMISAELKNKLVATEFIEVDDTLVAQPGDTITVPTWKYIGMAEDLGENEEGQITELQATYEDHKVKKAVKNVTLTDEAVLSAYGDPIGETNTQLALSLKDKIEQDAIDELNVNANIPEYEETGTAITYDTVVEAIDMLEVEEQGIELYLLVSREDIKTIRKDPNWVGRESILGDELLRTGVVGSIGGAFVKVSNRLPEGTAHVLSPNCITAFLKRDISLETARGEEGVLYKRTLLSGDAHYVIGIKRYDKLVKIVVTG